MEQHLFDGFEVAERSRVLRPHLDDATEVGHGFAIATSLVVLLPPQLKDARLGSGTAGRTIEALPAFVVAAQPQLRDGQVSPKLRDPAAHSNRALVVLDSLFVVLAAGGRQTEIIQQMRVLAGVRLDDQFGLLPGASRLRVLPAVVVDFAEPHPGPGLSW